MSRHIGHALRFPGVLPQGLDALVVLGPRFELESIESVQHDSETLVLPAGHEVTPAAGELRRSVMRRAAGAHAGSVLEERLRRLSQAWRRSRGHVALLRAESRTFPGPHLFQERVGCHTLAVSWTPLGGVGEVSHAYEVEVRTRATSGNEPKLVCLGTRLVPGGAAARSYTVRRLRPSRYHHVRVRALGPARSWVSAWSNELSTMTLSEEAARAAGHRMTANGFFAPSERCIADVLRGDRLGRSADRVVGAVDEPPGEGDMEGLRVAAEGLHQAFGHLDVDRKELLDARKCQGGLADYVRLGMRYSRPSSSRDRRIQRMRLALTAQDMYDATFADGNAWFMGPLYYDREP